MARPLRVLFYLESPNRFTGAQRQLLMFLRHVGPDLEPHVVAPAEGLCIDGFRKAGVDVTIIPSPDRLLVFQKKLLRIGVLQKAGIWMRDVLPHSWDVARHAREVDAEIIHFNTPRGILAAGPAAKLAGCRAVLHLRGSFPFDGVYRIASQAFADRILLNAEALREEIAPRFRDRCVAVHDGVEGPSKWKRAEARRALSEKLGLALDDTVPLVLTMSSPVPFKGLHVLLNALVELRRGGQPLPLVLCAGSSNDERYTLYLRDRIATLKLDQTHLLGYFTDPEQLVTAADVLVLPTIDRTTFRYPDGETVSVRSNEGLPQAILEALAAGVPVIASRVAGTPEEVTDGVTGRLVPQEDPRALAAALGDLLREPTLRARMGMAARKDVLARFDADTQARRTLQAIREAGHHEALGVATIAAR